MRTMRFTRRGYLNISACAWASSEGEVKLPIIINNQLNHVQAYISMVSGDDVFSVDYLDVEILCLLFLNIM